MNDREKLSALRQRRRHNVKEEVLLDDDFSKCLMEVAGSLHESSFHESSWHSKGLNGSLHSLAMLSVAEGDCEDEDFSEDSMPDRVSVSSADLGESSAVLGDGGTTSDTDGKATGLHNNRSYQQSTQGMIGDTRAEMKRLKSQVSIRHLLNDEIEHITKKRPGSWDVFWIGLLAVFVLFRFARRSFPAEWKPTGETVLFENIDATLQLLTGCFASLLLLVLFTSGRLMRWRLADGTVYYDSADDLHKLAALASSGCWSFTIVSGAIIIPLLHPILQVAKHAELCCVFTLLVGAFLSAYFRQWVLHRLCAWGLIYCAATSVFVGVSGQFLQAASVMSAVEINAFGYTVAFMVPIFGLVRDLICERSKMNRLDPNDVDGTIKEKKIVGARPVQAARGDKMLRLSLWQHLTAVEPWKDHQARRLSSLYNPVEEDRGGKPTFRRLPAWTKSDQEGLEKLYNAKSGRNLKFMSAESSRYLNSSSHKKALSSNSQHRETRNKSPVGRVRRNLFKADRPKSPTRQSDQSANTTGGL